VITALVPREEAKAFAEKITQEMRKIWKEVQGKSEALGTTPRDLGNLLRFSAFWIDKKKQRDDWIKKPQEIEAK